MHITTVKVEVYKNIETFVERANREVNAKVDELIKQGASVIDIDVQHYEKPGKAFLIYTIKHTPVVAVAI